MQGPFLQVFFGSRVAKSSNDWEGKVFRAAKPGGDLGLNHAERSEDKSVALEVSLS